jgi:hypothetical protein
MPIMTNDTPKEQQPGIPLIELPAIAMHGPFEMSMTIHVLTGEDKPARISMSLQPGIIPDEDQIKQILANCLNDEEGAESQIPAGTRLMTKREFWAHITMREAGIPLAMPGNQEFEKDEPREQLSSPLFGETEKPSSEERELINQFADEVPVALFQALGKKLNSLGYMLSVSTLDESPKH